MIIGNGPEREHLIRCARKINMEDLTEWKHHLTRQQLLEEYAKASVFVSLSPLESFSRVVHEAMLIGVPTVVLNFGATGEIAKRGLAEGINSLSPDIIAGGILKALEKPPPKLSQTQDVCPSWAEYVDEILGIYQRIQHDKR